MDRHTGKGKLIYFSNEEWELIENKSKAANMNTTSFIRESALKSCVMVKNYEYLDRVTYEMNKIGTNINQVAKKVNTENIVLKQDIEMLKEGLRKIWRLLKQELYTEV